MAKLQLECSSCGYTWYPEKEKWERNPDADEPDCPNPDCLNYGKGVHSPQDSIWIIKGEIKV